MGWFDDDTAATPVIDGRWSTHLTKAWDIGGNANGGAALTPVVRALRSMCEHPDPISVTSHFIRPVDGERPGLIRGDLIRQGRTVSVARGTLESDGRNRLTVLAAFGDLAEQVGSSGEIHIGRPDIPPPDDCVDRTRLDQRVDLPILDRLDVRLHPQRARAGGSPDAVMEGWIRFRDRTEPSPIAMLLFADAFPPSLYPFTERIGWVPTVELTVHVRRRPAPGWICGRFECDDLTGGRMIETGSLWDSTGALVARSRQLGVLLDA